MELLIPGLAIVMLMAYASTRIKKAAALALEPEEVNTGVISIIKPAGFVNVCSPEDGLLFRAYTKEFADAAPKLRKAEATISVVEHSDAAEIVDAFVCSGGKVAFDRKSSSAERSILVYRDEEGVRLSTYLKLVQKGDSIYKLQFDTPAECSEEFEIAAREMNNSFAVTA